MKRLGRITDHEIQSIGVKVMSAVNSSDVDPNDYPNITLLANHQNDERIQITDQEGNAIETMWKTMLEPLRKAKLKTHEQVKTIIKKLDDIAYELMSLSSQLSGAPLLV